jgi:hypothetical protein
MHPYTALLASQHLQDLVREADAARLADTVRRHQSRPTDRGGFSRVAARGARGLSTALASLAARIDPIEVQRSSRTAA